ncbi:hypothetical protein D3C84_703590 [compost metagenome]
MGHQPVVVHTRVALIDRHRVLPVTLLDRRQAFGDQVEGVFPLDRQPFAADPPHRLPQAIRIILNILQRNGLGTDMPAAERILGIPLDRGDLHTAFDLGGFDGQAADGFTQVAGTVMESLGHGQSLSCSGRAIAAAGTKLWRVPRHCASDVRLVNRRPSGQPMTARDQFDGSLGGACN